MKAAIFNPYLDTLGGGERYTMAIATTLLKKGYKVEVQWADLDIKGKLEKRFDVDLAEIKFIADIKKGDGYDICFWVSDGSIPALKARKNFLHFQVPFKSVGGRALINKMKFFRIKKTICNSSFTKRIIDQEFGIESAVLYPPVAVEKFKPKKKENVILYVGRFSALKQAKRQDVLIEAFKKLSTKNYKLVLAGGVEVGVGDYLDELKESAKGYNIEFVESPSFVHLKDLYAKAKLFWSGSGFEIDEQKNPEKVEHFGITVVEAMAAKCIPLIYNAGGHKEIVEENKDGFLWNSVDELVAKTASLIADPGLVKEISTNAQEKSKKFSYDEFESKFTSML